MLPGKLMPVYKKEKAKPIVGVYTDKCFLVMMVFHILLLFLFNFCLAAIHGLQDLSSLTGIEPRPLTVKAQSPNHWTTKLFPSFAFPWILKERNSDDRIMHVFYFQFFWNIFLKYFKCQQWNIFLKCVWFFYNQKKKTILKNIGRQKNLRADLGWLLKALI